MKKGSYAICILIIALIFGCMSSNQSSYKGNGSGAANHLYTSSFPYKDVSNQLEQIQRSVLRFTVTGFYKTYFFSDRNITLKELRQKGYSQMASRTSNIDQSKAGSAISILQNNTQTVLITALHTLTFPDTIVVYKKGRNIPSRTFVESLGIKNNQRNYLYTGSQILSLNMVSKDESKDLALIEVETPKNNSEARPLYINMGKAKNLRLGSFIYILGYPLGSPMVTRGIVSAPDYDGMGKFLTDALFNHGISGGLIIASRHNFRGFEWVGMAITASASKQQFLIPDPSQKSSYKNFEAYTDTAIVSERRVINYGLTQATPIEQILEFLLQSENELNDLGFSATDLMN